MLPSTTPTPTPTATPSQPYGRCNGYHRPRPKFTQAVTASSIPYVETTATPVNSVIHAKPLPSRPANHLQQQQQHHIGYDGVSSTPIHKRFAKIQLEEEEEEILFTRIEVLQDEESTPTRPSLTSKFSFDNLTAMDSQSGGSGGGGALKKMATRAWLQSITQAARNSTFSTTSPSPSISCTSNPPTRPGTPNHNDELHQLSQSPERPSKPTQSSSFLSFRSRETKESSSSSSSTTKPVTSSKTSRSTSPSKHSLSQSQSHSRDAIIPIRPKVTMTISNPELVHPATGGMLLNTHLGEGARRVGLPAEAFIMTPAATSSHRIYHPPASPPPRRSEDSIRSFESSSTSATAISYGSNCTTSTTLSNSASSNPNPNRPPRQDRELPYLPLRIKNVDGSRTSEDSTGRRADIVDDIIEQLVPTPGLPPESAKYIFNHLYSHEKSIKDDAARREEAGGKDQFERKRNSNDEIPFGHSALSRPTSASKLGCATPTAQGMDTVTSPISPTFARISPLSSSRRNASPENLSTPRMMTHPARPSSPSKIYRNTQQPTKQVDRQTASASDDKKSFHAMLLQPVPVFPFELSDDDKLINVHVGGSKVFTTRLSAITSHPDSYLAQFLTTRLQGQEITSKPADEEAAKQEAAPVRTQETPKEVLDKSKEPHMVENFPIPASVTLTLPTTPIHALRSARASIFNDVPSDECDDDTNEPVDLNVFGDYTSVNLFREKLDVPLPPFPNPRKGGMRFTRFTNLSSTSVEGAEGEYRNITASSSEYASTEMEDDNALDNFLDTTPDEEPEDPFHFQGQSASPMPSVIGVLERTKIDQDTTQLSLEMARDSHYSAHTPSLSSSPNSSAYQVDSPILLSSASTRFLKGEDAFKDLITQHEQHVLHPLNVYLDRNVGSYDAIFHWLRNGSLPRRLCLDDAITAATMHTEGNDAESVHAILNSLPVEARNKIMPLVLHPIMAEVKELRDEALYLGFSSLVSACDVQIASLRKAIRWSRNVVGHPGMHTRSESEGGVTSPAKLLGKYANRPRPRLAGHRHYDSESKVVPRTVHRGTQDNWI